LVAPARESSIVVGSLLGWLVLREPRPARRLAGAAVVLAGVAALALG
nr:EamA family transporter [Actinomycetota bacterium]